MVRPQVSASRACASGSDGARTVTRQASVPATVRRRFSMAALPRPSKPCRPTTRSQARKDEPDRLAAMAGSEVQLGLLGTPISWYKYLCFSMLSE